MSSVTDVSMGDHIDLMIKESESIAAGLAAAVIAIPENVAHTVMGPPEDQAMVVRGSAQQIRNQAMNDARIAEVIMAIGDNNQAERVFNNLVAFAHELVIADKIEIGSAMIEANVSDFTFVRELQVQLANHVESAKDMEEAWSRIKSYESIGRIHNLKNRSDM